MANLDGSSVSVLYNPPDGSNTKQFCKFLNTSMGLTLE